MRMMMSTMMIMMMSPNDCKEGGDCSYKTNTLIVPKSKTQIESHMKRQHKTNQQQTQNPYKVGQDFKCYLLSHFFATSSF